MNYIGNGTDVFHDIYTANRNTKLCHTKHTHIIDHKAMATKSALINATTHSILINGISTSHPIVHFIIGKAKIL